MKEYTLLIEVIDAIQTGLDNAKALVEQEQKEEKMKQSADYFIQFVNNFNEVFRGNNRK